MILMDLKRVELAGYNGQLPHLLVPVITEPEKAKAALKWAVAEMEHRYQRFAGATARNIRAYNESPGRPGDRAAVHRDRHRRARRPDDARGQERRGPDRPPRPEGARDRHPHGPRHAAPVGQRRHRPDQGQLPEPDRVRDGEPDRQPHDPRLAGRRGPDRPRRHALPAHRDLPRPIRHQGVFVSDRGDRGASSQYWCDQVDDPRYDLSIITLRRGDRRATSTSSRTTTPTGC